MTAFYEIVSCHGHPLAVGRSSREVVSGPDALGGASAVSVVGFAVPARPATLFLIANEAALRRLAVALTALEGAVLPFHLRAEDTGGTVLRDVTTNKILCAVIPRADGQAGRLEGNRVVVSDWERFRLVALGEAAVSDRARSVAAAVGQVCGGAASAACVLECLRGSPPPDAAYALDAIVPYLGMKDLEAIASALLSDDACYQRFAAVYRDDVWSRHAIPALRRREPRAAPEAAARPRTAFEFIRRRGKADTATHGPAPGREGQDALPQPQRLDIGAGFDELAEAGLNGAFVSLPHACAHTIRRGVTPRRRLCMLATARNEGIYLLDWIAYHRSIGVEWFYIYSNDNHDASDGLLAALANAGIITWIRNTVAPGVSPQRKAYAHALGVLPGILDFEWALTLDVDEFIVPNPERFETLEQYLRWQEHRAVDAIALNWRFMASEEGHDCREQPLLERNSKFLGQYAIGEGWRLVKSLFRPRLALHSTAHAPIASARTPLVFRASTGDLHSWSHPPPGESANPGFSDTVDTDNACIYHFFHKSADEWLWKSARNRGDQAVAHDDCTIALADEWVGNFMLQHGGANEERDTRLPFFLEQSRRQARRLHADPQIRAALAEVKAAHAARLALIKTMIRETGGHERLSSDNRRFLSLVGVDA